MHWFDQGFMRNSSPVPKKEYCDGHSSCRHPIQIWNAAISLMGSKIARILVVRYVICHHIYFWTTKEIV